MIEPIPNADEADTAEQARPADGGIEEHRPLPDVLGNNPDADAADIFEQQLSVSSQDDDHPPAADRAVAGLVTGGVFWLAWEASPLTKQRPVR